MTDEHIWKPFLVFCILMLVVMVLFTAYSSATYWGTRTTQITSEDDNNV